MGEIKAIQLQSIISIRTVKPVSVKHTTKNKQTNKAIEAIHKLNINMVRR